MLINDVDVLTQFLKLSKALESLLNIKQDFYEAHSIYQELLEVRKKLAEIENNFPKFN